MPHPTLPLYCHALVVAGGGRDLDWASLSIAAALSSAAAGRLVQLLLHGGARGADRAIVAAAHRLGWPVQAMPAQWARYGLAAGPVRNGQMLRNASEEAAAYHRNGPTSVLVVAFPGLGGTGIPPAAGPSPPGAFAALHRNPRSCDLRQPQQGGSASNHLLLHAFNVCRLPGAGIHPLDRRLISQQRHCHWIQRYLAQGLSQGQPQARTA